MVLNIRPSRKMPAVGGTMKIIDLDTNKYIGYAVMLLINHKNQRYLNLKVILRNKASGKYETIGQFSIRIPIIMMAMMTSYIKKKYGLNYKGKKHIWEFKTYEDI